MFQIAETETFEEEIKALRLQQRFDKARKTIYSMLKENPYYGKKLKGNYAGLYRYRLGDYRLIYSIDEEEQIVFMLHVVQRKDAY
ncbi:type II toxin-antitoxin system RelE family toxin [Turneriella parva]|uniref:Addiction module toxin, RelE/StbE family n=1 Tax=Turneriella parva (strain ATCC BAA-1111 / DSM 21527 / NCTC 11395 / H) TaxID=869212 RepID=I4B9L8_TURPD|nr:type II toxin-antitoxin system RelE/ParE family toxin [Turneriella parva]AFM13975.1 addiction module toxin, RelE/StbE family [Turneriella parva DSM 21527]